MITEARLLANRRNAQLSTGPRSEAGKERSSHNAIRHGLTSRNAMAVRSGPFADDVAMVEAYVNRIVDELAPQGTLEHAEAEYIAGLCVRRARLVRLEAAALGVEVPGMPMPGGGATDATGVAAVRALASDLTDRLPRYETHLSRELDRALRRYAELQGRRGQVVDGQLVG